MTTLVALAALAVGTYLFKAAGPVLAAGRALPEQVRTVAELLPASLLAALVATQVFASGTQLVIDARLAGIVCAALAVALRAPFAVVVLVGAGITALVRTLGWA